jgi:uncharacterized protein
MTGSRTPAPATYVNPYAAGVVLGLLLFASIALAGRGLGASGGFTVAGTAIVAAVSPEHVAQHAYLSEWAPHGALAALTDWSLLELTGVVIGAFASARLARRQRAEVEHTRQESSTTRLVQVIIGGTMLGVGARLARGCTSGLGLTGGALTSTGAWIFMAVAFATAFATAFLLRWFPSSVILAPAPVKR